MLIVRCLCNPGRPLLGTAVTVGPDLGLNPQFHAVVLMEIGSSGHAVSGYPYPRPVGHLSLQDPSSNQGVATTDFHDVAHAAGPPFLCKPEGIGNGLRCMNWCGLVHAGTPKGMTHDAVLGLGNN